jgi:hypothetical protein
MFGSLLGHLSKVFFRPFPSNMFFHLATLGVGFFSCQKGIIVSSASYPHQAKKHLQDNENTLKKQEERKSEIALKVGMFSSVLVKLKDVPYKPCSLSLSLSPFLSRKGKNAQAGAVY